MFTSSAGKCNYMLIRGYLSTYLLTFSRFGRIFFIVVVVENVSPVLNQKNICSPKIKKKCF